MATISVDNMWKMKLGVMKLPCEFRVVEPLYFQRPSKQVYLECRVSAVCGERH